MSKWDPIFISYSSRDAGLAAVIAGELEKSGVSLIDPIKTLSTNDSWRDAIRAAMERSKALLLIVGSPDAASAGWQMYETGMFEAAGKPVIVLAPNTYALADLPIELRDTSVRMFDPRKPELVVRSVASEILAAA